MMLKHYIYESTLVKTRQINEKDNFAFIKVKESNKGKRKKFYELG